MAVINRVPELLAERFGGADNINLSQVQRETDLTYSTVLRWYRDRVDRFDKPALEAWCKYLGVGIGDLLVYVPEKQ